MESYILVMTTCASPEEAQDILSKVLKARLVACGNIVSGVTSWFHWKGAIEQAQETLLLLKTRKDYFKELKEWILTHHSYEVPEVIALPILLGSEEYLDWIKEETEWAV